METNKGLNLIEIEVTDEQYALFLNNSKFLGMAVDDYASFEVSEGIKRRYMRSRKSGNVHQIRRSTRA